MCDGGQVEAVSRPVGEVGPGEDHGAVVPGPGSLVLRNQPQALLPVRELVQAPPEALGRAAPVAHVEARLPVLNIAVDVVPGDRVRIWVGANAHRTDGRECLFHFPVRHVLGHKIPTCLAFGARTLQGHEGEHVRRRPVQAAAWQALHELHQTASHFRARQRARIARHTQGGGRPLWDPKRCDRGEHCRREQQPLGCRSDV
eukprot:CAMPEP_0179083082 /NCGR_PEP_ID=MMETSP0796-20121207/37497_1 /TAXON_ID=73915 /ORGANISM="Pyrodinium bahamense, Strain pbaha01" /LENGTH=200 /DNA_ID=CAMNT_0020780483 /DNA_START=391 /DNA_END=989 /DNA_ORIENTATION=+